MASTIAPQSTTTQQQQNEWQQNKRRRNYEQRQNDGGYQQSQHQQQPQQQQYQQQQNQQRQQQQPAQYTPNNAYGTTTTTPPTASSTTSMADAKERQKGMRGPRVNPARANNSGVVCGFCNKPGHTAEKCYHNPASPSFRATWDHPQALKSAGIYNADGTGAAGTPCRGHVAKAETDSVPTNTTTTQSTLIPSYSGGGMSSDTKSL